MNDNMPYQNSKEAESSSPMFGRPALIAQAAAPYLDQELTQALDLVVRISDCIETIQLLFQPKTSSILTSLLRPTQKGSTVRMASIEEKAKNIDFQGLYQSVRPYLKPRELSIANQFMNIYNMKRMMDNYQMIQSMMSMMNGSDNQQGNNPPPNDTSMGNQNFYPNTATPPNEETQETPPKAQAASYSDTYWNSPPQKSSQNFTEPKNQPTQDNAQMFDMLSSMVPPEQKGTLDAMKMMMDMGLFR